MCPPRFGQPLLVQSEPSGLVPRPSIFGGGFFPPLMVRPPIGFPHTPSVNPPSPSSPSEMTSPPRASLAVDFFGFLFTRIPTPGIGLEENDPVSAERLRFTTIPTP